MALATARALGEFGATLAVAGSIPGRTQTISLAVYDAMQRGDFETANILSAITGALGFSTIFLHTTAGGTGRNEFVTHSDEPPAKSRLAFLYSVPIAILGGLIGLGGAEFRLPVLAGPLGYTPRRAVPLNLSVSIVTIATSLAIRSSTMNTDPVEDLRVPIIALIAGAVTAALFGTALFSRLTDERLARLILVLLLAVGAALIVESVLPNETGRLLPDGRAVDIVAGILLGLGIGLISSLLGVAGGEVIIPTLVFAYGADIKVAGTASLLISLPTVAVGIIRYARRGAYTRAALRQTVAPIAIGSIVGALIGGALVGLVPSDLLKLGLGVILIASAHRVFSHTKS